MARALVPVVVLAILPACAPFTEQFVKEKPSDQGSHSLAGPLDRHWTFALDTLDYCMPFLGVRHAPAMPSAHEAKLTETPQRRSILIGSEVTGGQFLVEFRSTGPDSTALAYYSRHRYEMDRKLYVSFVEAVRQGDRQLCKR